MGSIKLIFVEDVRKESEKLILYSKTYNELEFLSKLLVFCNLLNIYYGIKDSKCIRASADIILDITGDRLLYNLYLMRNCIAHEYGSTDFKLLRSELPSYEEVDKIMDEIILKNRNKSALDVMVVSIN